MKVEGIEVPEHETVIRKADWEAFTAPRKAS